MRKERKRKIEMVKEKTGIKAYVCKAQCGVVSTSDKHECHKCGSTEWIREKVRNG